MFGLPEIYNNTKNTKISYVIFLAVTWQIVSYHTYIPCKMIYNDKILIFIEYSHDIHGYNESRRIEKMKNIKH